MQVKSNRGVRSRRLSQNAFKKRIAAHRCRRFVRDWAASSRQVCLCVLRHELRTPLAGILGMVELLQSAPTAGEQRQLVAALEKSGRQMESLLERIDTGNLLGPEIGDVSLQNFDGIIFLEQVVRAHWPAARNKGLDMYLLLDARLDSRWCSDIVYLRQLLDNLLANALKFTCRGHVVIEATPASGPAGDKNGLELRVADTGIGIPMRDGRRIYGVCEQGRQDSAQRSGSLGLGLYLCNRITRSLGGHLGHGPRPGGGTVFHLVLPGVMAPRAAPIRKLRPHLLTGLRCCLALEEPLKSVMENLLHRLGIEVEFAAEDRYVLLPPGVDAVVCGMQRIDPETLRRCGIDGDSNVLVLSRQFPPGQSRPGDGQETVVRPLPRPVLLSNLEPLMLRLALQGKLHASGGRGDSVE